MQTFKSEPQKGDIPVKHVLTDFPSAKSLRDYILNAPAEICIERASLKTEFLKANGARFSDPFTKESEAMKYMLQHKKPLVFPGDMLAGSVTTKRKGVLVFPEFLGGAIWPELMTISKRKQNPCTIDAKDVIELNNIIFDFWSDRSMMELVRHKVGDDDPSYKLHQRLLYFMVSKFNCQSHTIPDFYRVLHRGLNGLITEARERMVTATPESKTFYNGMILAMEGVIDYSQNLSAELERQAKACKGYARRLQLEKMADTCRRVPANPARTFYEAIQSIFTCLCALFQEQNNVGFSIGRLDQLLHPYYQNDIDSSMITRDEAVELLAHFWLKLGSTTPLVPDAGNYFFGGAGANHAITLGGCDRDGNNAVNEVTYLCLDVTEFVKIKDPNVIARIRPDDPPEYTRRVIEAIINTGSTPALVNDDITIKALQKVGISLEDARDYAHVGCVEPTSIGKTFGHTGALLVNVPIAIELVLHSNAVQKDEIPHEGGSGVPDPFASFDAFLDAVKAKLVLILNYATSLNNVCGNVLKSLLPQPLLNALFDGPMESGKQLLDGGAVYNSSGIAFVGLPDLIDSLYVIKKHIFEEKTFGFPELLKALKSNFKEDDDLYHVILNKTPHFGSGTEEVDAIGAAIVDFLYDLARGSQNYRSGRYNPGYWSVTAHNGFGRFSGAYPHGKKAKEPFASSLSPVSFASNQGPTAIFKSITSLDHTKMPNGMALNLKFNKSLFKNEEKMDLFKDLFKAYFKEGGMQVQFTIHDVEVLLDAKKHPEKYPDLMVRISGYTAYFNDLSDAMQDEIINRMLVII